MKTRIIFSVLAAFIICAVVGLSSFNESKAAVNGNKQALVTVYISGLYDSESEATPYVSGCIGSYNFGPTAFAETVQLEEGSTHTVWIKVTQNGNIIGKGSQTFTVPTGVSKHEVDVSVSLPGPTSPCSN